MKIYLTLSVLILAMFSCASTKSTTSNAKPTLLNQTTFVVTDISTDSTYGLTKKNPVNVGGVEKSEGPLNERRFLNALTGPNGEAISYFRAGSCCSFKTKNGFMGKGLLDRYMVTWEGSADTVSIYINMYDFGELKAPVGFGLVNN
jgi:hypothetical protein